MEILKKEDKNEKILRLEVKDIDLGLLEYLKREFVKRDAMFRYLKPHPDTKKIIIEIEKDKIDLLEDIAKEIEKIKEAFNV